MKLIIDIPDEDYKFIKDLQFYNSGRRTGRTIENNVINGIKTGTPYEEKPQGEWSFNPYDSCSYCSLCKAKAPFGYKNFCPECGADMRGDNNDNN